MHITDAEWEVMRVVWANGEVSSKIVSQVLLDKLNWQPATSKTLLNRLLKKGLLEKRMAGNKYIYSTFYDESILLDQLLQSDLNKTCNLKYGKQIEKLLDGLVLSKKDIQELKHLLDEKWETAPDQSMCHCPVGQCRCGQDCCYN